MNHVPLELSRQDASPEPEKMYLVCFDFKLASIGHSWEVLPYVSKNLWSSML
jgi:hypothetical protein